MDNPVYDKQEVYFVSENLLYKPFFFLKKVIISFDY